MSQLSLLDPAEIELNNEGQERQMWRTPQALFGGISFYFGPFVQDVAASEHNSLCENYLTAAHDGTQHPWTGPAWCNPPFGMAALFAAQAIRQMHEGVSSVLLLPSSLNSQWCVEALQWADLWTFRGRVAYVPEGDVKPSTPDRDSMLLHFDPGKSGGRLGGVLDPKTGEVLQVFLSRSR